MDSNVARGITQQLGNATVLGVAGTTLNLSVATLVSIAGKLVNKAISGTEATPTLDAGTGLGFVPVPANKGSVFVIGLKADGTLGICQGELQALDVSGNFIVAPEFPASIPDTICPIAYLVIKAGATYVATTTGWLMGTHNTTGVTGITYTFVNVNTLPVRPQIA
jgi:hypothetical protein